MVLTVLILFLNSANSFAASGPVVDDLQKAYQKEILFLMSYKKEIEKKLSEVQKDRASRLQAAKSEIHQLEEKLLSMQTQNELSKKRLSDLENESADKIDNQKALSGIVDQAALRFGKEALDKEGLNEQLTTAFSLSAQDLQSQTEYKWTEGEFFDGDGEKQTGKILSVGSIAKFAQKDGDMFSLYPAGDGHFKVWKKLPSGQAGQLKSSEVPEVLSAFVYEDASKEFQPKEEISFMKRAEAGGPIGAVIIGLGLLGLVLAGLRWKDLKLSYGSGSQLKQKLEVALDQGNFEEAKDLAEHQRGALGRLSRKLLQNLQKGRQSLEDLAGEVILKESQKLDRFSSLLVVFASVAPLLGLLGTVTGMIATFDTITEFGTGNPKLLSGGISEALVTTMFGLIVAVPILLVAQVLGSWGDRIKADMEQTAMMIINSVTGKKVSGDDGSL